MTCRTAAEEVERPVLWKDNDGVDGASSPRDAANDDVVNLDDADASGTGQPRFLAADEPVVVGGGVRAIMTLSFCRPSTGPFRVFGAGRGLAIRLPYDISRL